MMPDDDVIIVPNDKSSLIGVVAVVFISWTRLYTLLSLLENGSE